MRKVFLILVLFGVGFAFHAPVLVLGPNIEYGAFGAAAPAGIRGAFVPQANTSVDFFWLEPLGADGYGTWNPNRTNYIRFLAGAELSPFYGTVRAGIGFAPLPPPFAILEFRFVYSNENLFWSDVEMPMKPSDIPSVKDTWRAGYIFDRFYKHSNYAQIQSFDTQLGGKYISQKFHFSFLFHFTLIDISSDYDRKSFDYMRGIPFYSRDYVVAEELHAVYNFGRNFSWNTEVQSIFSGRQFIFYSPFKAYDKEPLSYSVISTGPMWIFNGGKSYVSVSPAFFARGDDNSLFKDSFKERILLMVNYKHFWDFRFGKK